MLPVRGATFARRLAVPVEIPISIHAPRAGSDRHLLQQGLVLLYFNPCSPCGERPASVRSISASTKISIHAPRAGSDRPGAVIFFDFEYFNPCSPCGERQVQHTSR